MFSGITLLFSLLFFTDAATAQRNGDLRLARGSFTSSSYSSGRLEIYIDGQWGTVCDDFFDFFDADVACRQLGYSGASSSPITANTNSTFGQGFGTIWLDNVACSGSESCLHSCRNRGIGVEDCTHSEDVAIFCSGSRFSSTDCSFTSILRNGELRLARGSSPTIASSGRLEIYINGQWGTVCDDSFSFTDANVACRQLGYTGASSSPITASSNSLFGQGSGQIWLDEVGCFASATCLVSCSNRGIGVEDCTHSEDVAIFCSQGSRTSTRDCSTVTTSAPITINPGTGVGGTISNLVGIIVGVTIGAIVLFVVIPIVICVVVGCCIAGGVGAAASSSRRSRAVTTTTSTPAATTATVVTTSSQQAAYPQSYPAAGTDVKQAPPPAYAAQPTEMSAYPPQSGYPPQGGYPPKSEYPPQSGYPPQGGYPPQSGYPPQGGYPPQ